MTKKDLSKKENIKKPSSASTFVKTSVDKKATEGKEDEVLKKKVEIPQTISVRELAEILELPVASVISELIKNGVPCTINEEIDFETAAIISEDLGFKVSKKEEKEEKFLDLDKVLAQEKSKNLKERPPIVTIMGHVDHGKTSLLDAIRETNVVGGESGGITQHIGAYQVEKKKKKITFIDTPGHEAFVAMRARGAQATDVAILVVAADDGVKPQTSEALNHARAAKVPIIVAITKIDQPGANIDKVKKELQAEGLLCEDWGGDTVCVPVSSKTKEGINELLEMILLVSEMEELKANPTSPAFGTIIESHIDIGKGAVATVLIQNGTLKLGDFVVIGKIMGKIRVMEDYKGERLKEATPSVPVKIAGFSTVPSIGDTLKVVSSEKEAKQVTSFLDRQEHVKKMTQYREVIKKEKTEEETEEEKEVLTLNVILKVDFEGSAEAICSSLKNLGSEEVKVKIIDCGVGDISESDIKTARATGALIYGFRVGVDSAAKKLNKVEKIPIYSYNVIYELIDNVYKKLEGLLTPLKVEATLGKAKVLQIFADTKKELIVGGKVTSGKIEKGARIKVIRKKEVVGKGRVANLRIQKKDVSEVEVGKECGVEIIREGKYTVETEDILEAYRVEERKRTL